MIYFLKLTIPELEYFGDCSSHRSFIFFDYSAVCLRAAVSFHVFFNVPLRYEPCAS